MCDNGAIAGFAHDKVIMPLDDILTSINADKSNIIPASLKWVTYQGKLYGLPFGQDTWALYYNTDMFTAAGLDPDQAAHDARPAVGLRRQAHQGERRRIARGGRLHPR